MTDFLTWWQECQIDGHFDWHGLLCHGEPRAHYWCKNGLRCAIACWVRVYLIDSIPDWWYWNVTRRRG